MIRLDRPILMVVRSNIYLAFLLLAGGSLCGCSAGEEQSATQRASGVLTPGQEATAKTLGVDTPNDVKTAPGMYTGDINMAKRSVEDQQKKMDAENAAIKSMSGPR